MMIKFCMSRGADFTLNGEQANRLIESESQLVMVYDEQGQWTGKTINKAHVVSTDRDKEAESEEARKNRSALPEPQLTPEQREAVAQRSREIGEGLKEKMAYVKEEIE